MKCYLIGIKGSGMSALAQYLFDMGIKVRGADIQEFVFTEKILLEKNIMIDPFENMRFEDSDLVIVSTAHVRILDKYHIALPIFEYHEFASLLLSNQKVIAVSGTNGKTSLCNMLDCVFNHETNIIEGDGIGRYVGSDYTILEACEYRDHFLSYTPRISVILSLNYDHSDYFSSFDSYLESFRIFSKLSKEVYYHKSCLDYKFKGRPYEDNKNYYRIEENKTVFVIDGKEYEAHLPFYADYQYDLALISLRIAHEKGVNPQVGLNRLGSYRGPQRRLQVERIKESWIIDDYAHQPFQIQEAYKVACSISAGEKVLIFKPDRKTRLYDFKDDFNKVFHLFDKTYLIPYHEIDEEDLKYFLDSKVSLFSNFSFCNSPTVYLLLSSKMMKNEYELIKSLF